MPHSTRAGLVAIVGMPNAGKSSLLNRFLGSKLSIVTAAAQTTRERVVGIDTREGVQIVFMDTPGVVDPAYLLHQSMLGIIEKTIADADVVLLLLDATREPPAIPVAILARLSAARAKLIPVVNKTDVAKDASVARLEAWAADQFGDRAVPVSAETGEGVEELRKRIALLLPESPYLYPEEDISTQSVRFFVAELIRETIFEMYGEEVPYSAAVRVEEFREESEPVLIRATVYVERGSQKGILIGQGGQAIRQLGSTARLKIEAFVGRRIYLDLWIKVLPKWRKKAMELRRFGFPVPEDEVT